MAVSVKSTYTNLMKIQLDKKSVNRTRNEIKSFAREMQGILNGVKIDMPKIPKNPNIPPPQDPNKPLKTTKIPATPEEKEDFKRKKDLADRNYMIESFLLSNRLAYQLDETEKDIHRTYLKQFKTKRKLRLEITRTRQELAAQNAEEKRLTKEMEKQNLLERRMNSSLMQMAGSVASAYTLVAAGAATMRTGMDFESIDKLFLVVSEGAEDAANKMAFAREEAMRLGTPLIETQKSYGKFLAAAGNKISEADSEGIFTGIMESSVALGLTQDEIGGVTKAVVQMMSKYPLGI